MPSNEACLNLRLTVDFAFRVNNCIFKEISVNVVSGLEYTGHGSSLAKGVGGFEVPHVTTVKEHCVILCVTTWCHFIIFKIPKYYMVHLWETLEQQKLDIFLSNPHCFHGLDFNVSVILQCYLNSKANLFTTLAIEMQQMSQEQERTDVICQAWVSRFVFCKYCRVQITDLLKCLECHLEFWNKVCVSGVANITVPPLLTLSIQLKSSLYRHSSHYANLTLFLL